MNTMKRRTRSALILLFALLFSGVIALPGMPWSVRLDRGLKRIVASLRVRAATLEGQQPRAALLSGVLERSSVLPEAVQGAEVSVVQSKSGYCSLTDSQGRFTIPHLVWYPGARYNLLVMSDSFSVRRISITAPAAFPENGVIDAGRLYFEGAVPAMTGETPIAHMVYDRNNDSYYRELFDRLAAGLEEDSDKIDRICKFVSTKLNRRNSTPSFHTPRDILELGSCYCSNLALAMAAITSAGNLPTRTVHMTDNPEYTRTHVTVEVYYGDRWHLYDPTYGVHYSDPNGVVASYKQLRLNPELVAPGTFSSLAEKEAGETLAWMLADFASGYNQIYLLAKDQACTAW
jgi:hypothetical protein